jgi:hypothetical protein
MVGGTTGSLTDGIISQTCEEEPAGGGGGGAGPGGSTITITTCYGFHVYDANGKYLYSYITYCHTETFTT